MGLDAHPFGCSGIWKKRNERALRGQGRNTQNLGMDYNTVVMLGASSGRD